MVDANQSCVNKRVKLGYPAGRCGSRGLEIKTLPASTAAHQSLRIEHCIGSRLQLADCHNDTVVSILIAHTAAYE